MLKTGTKNKKKKKKTGVILSLALCRNYSSVAMACVVQDGKLKIKSKCAYTFWAFTKPAIICCRTTVIH